MNNFLMIFLSLIVFSSTSFGGELSPNNTKLIQLLSDISSPNNPGIQYIVVNKNTVVFDHSSGQADIKNKTALTKNHTMAAFSMTKTLTAIGILQLVEMRKVELNSRLSGYLKHPYSKEITIRQLLSHTSGIPDPIPLKWIHLANEHNTFDEKKALSQVLSDNSNSTSMPGEEYEYSNIGYWLLGGVIEVVSGQSYPEYISENIFKPLNLYQKEIGFAINENNYAKGYLKKYSFMNLIKSFLMEDFTWGEYEKGWLHINNVYLNGPAFGGAIGSATAFSKILQDLLSEQPKLLGEESKRLLYSQQKTKTGNNINMTLGWHIDKLNGVTYYYKEGGGAGFHCEMRIYPEKDLASVIMTNKTSFNSRDILSELDENFVEN